MLGFAGPLSSSMIKTEIRERIATIELARLDKKNALTAAMYAAMTDTLATAESDSGVRAIVIHGTRDCFTAGNDLKDFLQGPAGASQALRFVSALSKVCKPVVAAVGGPAVGIGTTLLLHCDLVYAAPGARFPLPFVPLGLVAEAASSLPPPGGTTSWRACSRRSRRRPRRNPSPRNRSAFWCPRRPAARPTSAHGRSAPSSRSPSASR